MPSTPIYGLPYEALGDQPGVTLTGGDPPSSPILAEAVEAELERIDNTVAVVQGLAGLGTQFAYKPDTQTVTNSTTLVDDSDLVLSVAAGAIYHMESALVIGGSSNGDIQLQWVAPAGAVFDICGNGLSSSATGSGDNVVFFVEETNPPTLLGTLGTGGNSRPAFFAGVIEVGGTAGNFRLRWAQMTANATGTSIRQRSYLKLTRFA